ncbi:MAG: DNA-processing protein DprA [Pseudomonadota bacterium]
MEHRPLDDAERLAWMRLIRTSGIGPATFLRLLKKFGSAQAAIEKAPAFAQKSGRKKPLRISGADAARAEFDAADRIGARFVALVEPDYPALLRAIPDPPPLLCVAGHPHLFEKRCVAIVGSRNASAPGRKMARAIARELGAAGAVVVSGLARGIDGVAHGASLETGTVAVVAGGVDVIYPPEHGDLHRAIAEQGAVVSERPIGYQPTARDFPRRNRIISGLAAGVLVVEAASKSGTLITARFALEQGREVFAVPGSPLDPRCQGTNRLIRDGAALTETAADILDILDEQRRHVREPDWDDDFQGPDAEADSDAFFQARRTVLDLLSPTPVHRDELARESSLSPGVLADVLLELVLTNLAEEHPGGRFALCVDGRRNDDG